jgi:hypothetical protein
MKKILQKYSNNKLTEITDLPLGFIRGFRGRIFRNAMMVSLETEIKLKVNQYQNKL